MALPHWLTMAALQRQSNKAWRHVLHLLSEITQKFCVFGWPFHKLQNKCTKFIIAQVASGDAGNVLKTQNKCTWAKQTLCKGGPVSYLRSSSVGIKQTGDCSITLWKSSTPLHLAFFRDSMSWDACQRWATNTQFYCAHRMKCDNIIACPSVHSAPCVCV